GPCRHWKDARSRRSPSARSAPVSTVSPSRQRTSRSRCGSARRSRAWRQSERRRDWRVTYIIGEACIDVKDISCQSVCPVDCIHEMDRMLVIDPEECIDCGACEPECPVEAILPEDAIPDDWQPFVPINYAFPDKDAINRMVDEVKPSGEGDAE